ncbi:glycosyltransferase family protein [Ulvibacter antarcticus]|uniref:UDP-N-acetylglucosamine:LPS N-acetylglucosamine transferase n=1 Tax=Ulvibacter antarcticus TaxID=442714 RepID=A0A3L9YET4_9FLAO|nr:UDP-glycosyltransferase [Ulvibacter antarcticus]RMA57987.1 UDP-N-acetylglucosamine:LPS N-acetylglucosamine transferase [Ulvibacter antarcticus]
MIESKKIFLVVPDGVGLRNFVYTSFAKIGAEKGWDITYWNNTPFDFTEFGLQEVRLSGKVAAQTDLYKRARKEIELQIFEQQFQDDIYKKYTFKPASDSFKKKLKNYLVRRYIQKYKGENLYKLREKIKDSERKTAYYKNCVATLKQHKPEIVFSTNQRPVNAISPIVAAQDLGIPTATFIFSWDNIPKATMVIETDYYFVWSEHMKQELLTYYPYVKEEQIYITGTPQFEPHFNKNSLVSRTEFLTENKLPKDKEYICYSGDDITTSPHDPQYLEAVALAVRKLNAEGRNLGILFRRCPVDFSDRFDLVLETYKDIIYKLPPKWEKKGGAWNTVVPLKEDIAHQANTINHSAFVVNVGSSMVFDYICHNKPCAFINYNPEEVPIQVDIHTIYKYVHFRSMPTPEAVVWFNNTDEISEKIEKMLSGTPEILKGAQQWFEKINLHPPQEASQRIWNSIDQIVDKT